MQGFGRHNFVLAKLDPSELVMWMMSKVNTVALLLVFAERKQ